MNSPTGVALRPLLDRWDGALGWAIMRTKLRIRRNRFALERQRHPARVAILTLLVIPVAAAIGLLLLIVIATGFRSAASDEQAGAILATLVSLVALGAFVGSSTTALQSLYLANDLPFLLTLPIPLRVLYAGKLLEASAGAVPAALLLLVSFAAYGIARTASSLFALVALVCGVLVLALATSLAVVVVALVTRYIPAKRARLFLFGISLTLVAITSTIWTALAAGSGDLRTASQGAAIAALGRSLSWTPAGWAARAVVGAGNGNLSSVATAGCLLVVASCIVGLASFRIFAGTFTRGLAMARATPLPRPSRPLALIGSRAVAILPRPLGALVVKEWLTIFRDLRRLSGAVWPLGMVAIYAVGSSRQQHSAGGPPELRFWLANASLALVPWGASLGISIYAFGTERRNVNLLRTLPVTPGRLFLAKTIASLVPVLVLSETATVIVCAAQRASAVQVFGLVVLVGWMSVGYVTIDTAAAAVAPNFDADHVQRSTAIVGRAFGFVAGGMFGVATMIGAARLILFTVPVPALLQPAVAWRVADVAPLGWPLVGVALTAALLVIAAVTLIARDEIADLVRNGP